MFLRFHPALNKGIHETQQWLGGDASNFALSIYGNECATETPPDFRQSVENVGPELGNNGCLVNPVDKPIIIK